MSEELITMPPPPLGINPEESYIQLKYNSEKFIDEFDKWLGGYEFQTDGTYKQNKKREVVTDWARKEIINLVYPYTTPTVTMGFKTRESVNKTALIIHKLLYFLLLMNMTKAGIESAVRLGLIVNQCMDLIYSNLEKAILAKFLLSDRTSISMQESKSDSNLQQRNFMGDKKGLW